MRWHLRPLAVASVVALTAVGLVGLSMPAAAPVATAIGDDGTVHFTAAGDYATGVNTAAVLTTMAARKPDLNLALGDLSYGVVGAEQSWCDYVTARVGAGFPFELLAGNHESNGQNGHINDFAACLPNQLPGLVGTYGRQWYVDVPQGSPLVRFVMISPGVPFTDSVWDYGFDTPRYRWTEAAIDGARAAAIPWVVVGMHKPCLSMGQYLCESGRALNDLLLAKKVDLVLSGHEHLYQRTKQLAFGPGCTTVEPNVFDRDCIADADGSMVKGAGPVFATVGTGGVGQRAVNALDPEAEYFAASSGLDTATWGLLDVQVSRTQLHGAFVRAAGGTFSDAFTIDAGTQPANTPPVAAFSAQCTGLTCTVDGSGSTDSDGTVVSHAWDFGDGATGSGATATHSYAAAGSYAVTLTVTDSGGATGTTTKTVTPATTTSAATPFAADRFERAVTSGFGAAEIGGEWRVAGGSGSSVTGGAGRVRVGAGGSADVSLPAVSSSATDLVLALGVDRVPTGSGLYAAVVGRRVSGVGEYRTKLHLRPDRTVGVTLIRKVGTTETALAPSSSVPGLTYAATDRILVRSQVTGRSPTTLRARVWKAGTAEPTAWHVSTTETTSGLQTAGAIGVHLYLSSSATNGPVEVSLDDLVARAP